MLRNLFARWLDGWRNEPDPATLDTPDDDSDGPDDKPLPDDATPEQEAEIAARYAARRQRYQDRERAIAAGLACGDLCNGFQSFYAAAFAVRGAMMDEALAHDYRRHAPADSQQD